MAGVEGAGSEQTGSDEVAEEVEGSRGEMDKKEVGGRQRGA